MDDISSEKEDKIVDLINSDDEEEKGNNNNDNDNDNNNGINLEIFKGELLQLRANNVMRNNQFRQLLGFQFGTREMKVKPVPRSKGRQQLNSLNYDEKKHQKYEHLDYFFLKLMNYFLFRIVDLFNERFQALDQNELDVIKNLLELSQNVKILKLPNKYKAAFTVADLCRLKEGGWLNDTVSRNEMASIDD